MNPAPGNLPSDEQPAPVSSPAPPRAFTQGVGTVFQFSGVILFLVTTFVCCASSLTGREWAARRDRTEVGWHLPGDAARAPSYSVARAITVSVFGAMFFGLALAGIGLGLQATNRFAPPAAAAITLLACAFWIGQTVFAIQYLHWVFVMLGCLLTVFFAGLGALAIGAVRDMRKNPPPSGQEILPSSYQIPYSHLHQDPPEVRLARELEQRRQKLAVQQKELEMLEEKLKRKMNEEKK